MMRDPLNRVIMEDIGLTVNQQNIIMDQDTREVLKYKDKNMRYSSHNSVTLTNQDMTFDPASNKTLMGHLFNHFLGKLEEEDDIYVPRYSEDIDSKGRTAIIAKVTDEKGKTQEMKSGYYYMDSLKYVDMVKQLNGSESTDMSEYDKEPEPEGTRKRKKVNFR